MSKTARELAGRALARLGKVATGQAPAEEDMQIALTAIDPLLAELVARKIVYVGDTDAIEDRHFSPLTTLLANAIAEEFEVSPESVQAWAMRAGEAQKRLLEMMDDADDEAPVKAVYY